MKTHHDKKTTIPMKNNIYYKSSALLLIAAFTLFSCDLLHLNWGNKYTIGHFPTSPVNLEEFNTEFDDYNSDIPVFMETFPFCFSSNRNSNGENYDIVYKLMSVEFSKKPVNLIFFTQNIENEYYENPIAVEFLNSDFDDAYPTFNNDNSKLYFTSNRTGKFDIYKIKTNNSKEIVEILNENSSASVEKDAVLSSESDDKCPSITNNMLVFASNRAGGFGGYDIYYSVFENGNWSEPVNFGRDINSEYDEFRPILRSDEWQFDNDMMIFSSNRPGGKGGFDLYYVGIERKEEI
jgi:hypothetical protein